MPIYATADLAEKIRRAMRDRTHDDIRDSGGPSSPTLTKILKGEGEPISLSTAKRLDQALGWPAGTTAAMSRGELETLDGDEAAAAVTIMREQLNPALAQFTDHELTVEIETRMLLMASRLHAAGDDTLTFFTDADGSTVVTSRPAGDPR